MSGNFAYQYTAFPPSPPLLAEDAVRPPQQDITFQDPASQFVSHQSAPGRPRTYDLSRLSPSREPSLPHVTSREPSLPHAVEPSLPPSRPRTPPPAPATESQILSPQRASTLNKKRSRDDHDSEHEPDHDSDEEVVVIPTGKENTVRRRNAAPKSAGNKKIKVTKDDTEEDWEKEQGTADRAGKQWTVEELNVLIGAVLGHKVSSDAFIRLTSKNQYEWRKVYVAYSFITRVR